MLQRGRSQEIGSALNNLELTECQVKKLSYLETPLRALLPSIAMRSLAMPSQVCISLLLLTLLHPHLFAFTILLLHLPSGLTSTSARLSSSVPWLSTSSPLLGLQTHAL